MDLSNPLRSLMRPRQADVLEVLSATTGALSGRQVHQIGGAGSVEGVRGALLQLVDTGVVDVEQRPLPVLHASSFGSAARSDGDASSDVDLLLVPVDAADARAAVWEAAVDDLCVAVERWSGNVAHVQTVTREQLHRMAAVAPPPGELVRRRTGLDGRGARCHRGDTMSPRAGGRVAMCLPAQARGRRQDAEELLAAAEAMTGTTPGSRKAASAISVLAAIAAAGAICGAALGRYSRG